MGKIQNKKILGYEKLLRRGADWSLAAVTNMTVSDKTFGSRWLSTYEDCLQRRLVTTAYFLKYDWKVVLSRYGRLKDCTNSCADSNDVIDLEIFRRAERFVQMDEQQ